MRCTPEQKNPHVFAIFAAILIFGLACYAVPIVCRANEISIAAMPFNVLALVSVVAALYLMIRYRMTTYSYVIRLRDECGGESEADGLEKVYASEVDITKIRPELLDFCVYRAQGTRLSSMECLLSLGDLVEVMTISCKKGGKPNQNPTSASIRERYAEKGEFTFYDYTLTLGLDSATELVFIDGERYVGIIIEADAGMANYLNSLK